MRTRQLSFRGAASRPVVLGGIAVAILVLGLIGVKVFFSGKPVVPKPGDSESPEGELAAGTELFANHCAQCHGEKGDGNGPAARFLYPKPRNFGEAKFRIVSTENYLPTDEDLLLVVNRGMPGSAMFPFAHLPESDRKLLVGHVRHLMRSGMEERLRLEAKGRGDEPDAEELSQAVKELTTPGQSLAIPVDLQASGPESLVRGKDIYIKICAGCHGEKGKGDGSQDQHNNDGMPTRPRDFTRGIFKGNRDFKQLYARTQLGMPGSPMPASRGELQPAQAADVVHFILSLSDSAAQAKVDHKRSLVNAKKVASLPDGLEDGPWSSTQAVPIVVSPLWWRDFEDTDLQVSALHDGQDIAIRLSWNDATKNESSLRPEDFEDMAALQLFKGKTEPFLGMGSESGHIDLWQWRSGWQKALVEAEGPLDDYPFDMPIYSQLTKGQEKQLPDFLTARAAGNQIAHGDKNQTAGSLAAKGFGSTTFRPKASQRVTARSMWKDGRWTVVLRRPLSVNAEEGIALAAGDQVSIAFAIWDGAARDRNGQKLVSIWHDLKLE